MTDTIITQIEPVFAAVDISQVQCKVLIAVSGMKLRRPMTMMTILYRLEDFNRKVATLQDHEPPVRLAFEATGNDHRDLGMTQNRNDLRFCNIGSFS